MPIELVVTFVDDTKKHFYIPIDLMRGVKKELSLDFETLPFWGWGFTVLFNSFTKRGELK